MFNNLSKGGVEMNGYKYCWKHQKIHDDILGCFLCKWKTDNVYMGKNPFGYPFIQIRKIVYNLIQGKWFNQNSCKKVSLKMQIKLNNSLERR